MRRIAALYCTADSIYKAMPAVDVYDEARDARTFDESCPVIAHPPCRLWSRMRAFSTAPASERMLAVQAVDVVRRCGGVLEHPAGSALWPYMNLPAPGEMDAFGFTTCIDQYWWGHAARKRSILYVCGVGGNMPRMPLVLGEAGAVVSSSSSRRPEIPKPARNATPPLFAQWLAEIARAAS